MSAPESRRARAIERSHSTDGFGPSPNERAKLWQKALNEKWPSPAVAQRLSRLEGTAGRIAVMAWVEWEHDGGEWVPAIAARWDSQHVFVRIEDERCRLGFWLSPQHIRRRDEA